MSYWAHISLHFYLINIHMVASVQLNLDEYDYDVNYER